MKGGVITGSREDDDGFLADARTFFLSTFSNGQLLSTGAALLNTLTLDQLVEQGLSSAAVRNALKALSIVSLDLPELEDRRLELCDQQSGTGAITEQWLNDRACCFCASCLISAR